MTPGYDSKKNWNKIHTKRSVKNKWTVVMTTKDMSNSLDWLLQKVKLLG